MQDSYAGRRTQCAGQNCENEAFRIDVFNLVYSSNSHEHYAEIDVQGGLVHLDGLHRMVSWEFYGMLNDGAQVAAYVAGKLNQRI